MPRNHFINNYWSQNTLLSSLYCPERQAMACLGAPPELPSIRPQTLSGTCGQMWLSHPSSVGSGSRSRHAQPAHWLAEGARTGCRWFAQMPPKVGCGVSIRLGVYIWGQAAPSILISLLPRSCLSVLPPGFVRFRFRRFVQEVPRCNSIYQTRYNHHHVYKSLRWVSFVEHHFAPRTARLPRGWDFYLGA